MTEKTAPAIARPLSPHLQIYRWYITMVVSILHRVTGVALAVGTVLLVGWLWAAAYDAHCFAAIQSFLAGTVGKLLLMGWSAAFYFHFCNGIRHLFWDAGKGFELTTARRTAWLVFLATAFFTTCTWATVFSGVKQ
ncbi:MAG TPA: succinate dehydrogenase, cytochrome b556 subunit [Rickettsiales bacterium]|nr:succinate dehydrogenase, cytochrome b556 subunit [Rickettsiales bacterium]